MYNVVFCEISRVLTNATGKFERVLHANKHTLTSMAMVLLLHTSMKTITMLVTGSHSLLFLLLLLPPPPPHARLLCLSLQVPTKADLNLFFEH